MSCTTLGLSSTGSSQLSHLCLLRLGPSSLCHLTLCFCRKEILPLRSASVHPCPCAHCPHTKLLLVSALWLVMSFLPGAAMHVCVFSGSVLSDSLQSHGLQPSRLFCPWDSPGKSTGVGCHFLLQGIFPTQESNLVSCIAGRFFTDRAMREAQII